jgi:hypothetical protein
MKIIKIKSASDGASAYPLRVSDCGDGLFQIVPAYAFRGDVRWTQDYELEVHNRAMADFICAALNAGVVLDAPAVKAVEGLCFAAESVAHLRGFERELLPACDLVRAKLEVARRVEVQS